MNNQSSRKYYSLYGRLLSRNMLYSAFMQVKKNKGAAGTDQQSLSDFELNINVELSNLIFELKEKTYIPHPVRRVTIPKPDGGERELGIPSVRDRVVQQALLNILEPIFDPDFHPSSYGYRKGRSCAHAITKATQFIRDYNRRWVVDMDISKCFDNLSHDLILSSLRKKVVDGSVLKLVELFLKSGVKLGDRFVETETGSPQGGVISPLLSNIYLDNFDSFMKSRGHRIVRYADDILILCRSKSGAENALSVAENYLENTLKLRVNKSKTCIVQSYEGVKFLGVEIFTKNTRIQKRRLVNFKKKVKDLTKRNQGSNILGVVKKLNPVLRGFVNYFRIANCKKQMQNLMGWIRRRLRCIQLKLWKKPTRLHRRLRQLGYHSKFKCIKMNSWRNSNSPLTSLAMPNKWFHEELKLVDMTDRQFGIHVSEM
jgi:group II intron reverse transcriptase/maturase